MEVAFSQTNVNAKVITLETTVMSLCATMFLEMILLFAVDKDHVLNQMIAIVMLDISNMIAH